MIHQYSVVFACLSLGTLVGCTSRTPVTVGVFDAESNEPIAGAVAQASYSGPMDFFAPKAGTGATNAYGIATVMAPKYRDIRFSATAPAGYLRCQRASGIRGSLDQILAARRREERPRGPGGSEIVFLFYAEPNPVVEITLPDNYRGPVLVRWVGEPFEPVRGQRLFRFEAHPPGPVVLPRGPLIDCPSTSVRGRYRTGVELPHTDLRPDQIGWRRVGARGPNTLFVVGAEADRVAAESQLTSIEAGDFKDFAAPGPR